MKIEGAKWLDLQWVTTNEKGERVLAKGVEPVVTDVGGGSSGEGAKMVKLCRTDLGNGKATVPVLAEPCIFWKIPFFDGNKNAPRNQSNRDTALSLTIGVDLPAYVEKLAELADAYAIAAVELRPEWAGAGWDVNPDFEPATVRRKVMSCFGYTPPKPRDMSEEKDKKYRLECINPRPRMPADDEYAGLLNMKIVSTKIVLPTGGETDAQLSPDNPPFYDADSYLREDKLVPLKREDIRFNSKGTLQYGCLGVAPNDKFSMWRVWGGFIRPAREGSALGMTEGKRSAMLAALDAEDEAEGIRPPSPKHSKLNGHDEDVGADEIEAAEKEMREYLKQNEN